MLDRAYPTRALPRPCHSAGSQGKNSYRNLVSCCTECNTQKGETAAEDFLGTLCRQRRITSAELAERLRKLDALAAGQLRPDLPTPQPKFVVGAPKPTPASYQRFPVGSSSYSTKPNPPIRPENLGTFARPGKPR